MTASGAPPRLRQIDARPVQHGGMAAYVLRDPMRLAEHSVVVAEQLGPALLLCDGRTHRGDMCASSCGRATGCWWTRT